VGITRSGGVWTQRAASWSHGVSVGDAQQGLLRGAVREREQRHALGVGDNIDSGAAWVFHALSGVDQQGHNGSRALTEEGGRGGGGGAPQGGLSGLPPKMADLSGHPLFARLGHGFAGVLFVGRMCVTCVYCNYYASGCGNINKVA